MKQKFTVTGMTCSACSSHVEKSVCKLPGMNEVTVNLLTNSMQVAYDESLCSEDKIIEAVEKAGYGANKAPSGGAQSRGRTAAGEAQGVRAAGTGSGEAGGAGEQAGGRTFSGVSGKDSAGREALKRKKENREMKVRLTVSIVFMILLMFVSSKLVEYL